MEKLEIAKSNAKQLTLRWLKLTRSLTGGLYQLYAMVYSVFVEERGLHGLNTFPANTKHLYNMCTTSAQRLRRWSNIAQILNKCFVFTGFIMIYFIA